MVVDKPAGMTSHDVVERVRRALRERVGHAGTLDPQATGVLLLCIGAATRLARFLQGHDKVYEGTVRLGWATDTYDAQGEALAEPVPVPDLDRATVEAALRSFVGEQEQTPPVYSAKKVRGQPSYRRARRGEDVRPKPVTVNIYALELLSLDAEELHIRVHCGAGTYVRTLAHDLGVALGCPAHLAALRRTRSGSFDLEGAVTWTEINECSEQELRRRVLPPADMVADWPTAVINAEGAAAVSNGGIVEAAWIVERRPGEQRPTGVAASAPDGWVRLLDGDGLMLAAGEMVPGGLVQPRIVLR
jgi:tRNA pseudouridine55 synthase